MDKKQKVLDKLKKLTELLDEVHDDDPNNLFHEDWIEVTNTISKINRNDEASPEILKRMNFIWRKNNAIKKWRAEHEGVDFKYEEIIDWMLRDIITHQGKISAIKYARENIIPSNGAQLTLIEAKEFIEKLINNVDKK